MKIIYKKGDFLEGSEKFVLHGCNAQGVMGSGAALAVKKKYPHAYIEYREEYVNNGLVLGGYVLYEDPMNGVTVINGITQEFYGHNEDMVYVSYEAVEKLMKELDDQASMLPVMEDAPMVAMPKIGAGLANGDWEIIEEIIEDNSQFWQPVVYILD